MIAVSSNGRSFRALASYLATGRTGEEQDRVGWTAGRNLPTDDPELAATFMRATAARSDRVEKPVYHIAISFDPGDPVDRATMERVTNRLLERLGLAEHQALVVSHRDREHPHLHIMVNRVHPETGKAWERWKDQPLIQQVLREEERALGLREVTGTLATERQLENPEPAQPVTRVDEVGRCLEVRERLVELTREQYHAQLDASAARSRVAQLDAAAERVRAAGASFDHALSHVYKNPEHARQAFLSRAEEKGVAAATQAMRAHPEQFGALKAVGRPRAFGLVRGEDDGQARAAAPTAAARGRD